ncbi:MAG: hypothetical protein COA79_17770 [Planctomycetota bacterium]|nr:MAG: hypothetical protein COA79_17770 [Planctomycetota bacterium]
MPHRIPNDLKTVFLDLDETIYDQKYSCEMGLKGVAEKYPEFSSVPLNDLENKYFKDLHHIHLKVMDGDLSEEDAHIYRFKSINQHYKFSEKSPKDFLAMIDIYNEASQSNKRSIPGAIETVAYLKNKGYCVIIITNGMTENQKRKTKLCGISDLIDFLIISEEIGIRKPDSVIFSIALKKADCKKEQAVMVGDSWDSDIKGSLNANIQPIWYNRGRHDNLDADKVIEIKDIIELQSLL